MEDKNFAKEFTQISADCHKLIAEYKALVALALAAIHQDDMPVDIEEYYNRKAEEMP